MLAEGVAPASTGGRKGEGPTETASLRVTEELGQLQKMLQYLFWLRFSHSFQDLVPKERWLKGMGCQLLEL